jgi:hypothetical protein
MSSGEVAENPADIARRELERAGTGGLG